MSGSRIWQGRVSNPPERGTPPKSALKVRAAGG